MNLLKDKKDKKHNDKLIVLLGSVALGIVADFFVNGVLKILWFPIYAPVYIGVALGVYNYVLRIRGKELPVFASLSFLSGAALCHVIATGRTDIRVYPMKMTADDHSSISLFFAGSNDHQ